MATVQGADSPFHVACGSKPEVAADLRLFRFPPGPDIGPDARQVRGLRKGWPSPFRHEVLSAWQGKGPPTEAALLLLLWV